MIGALQDDMEPYAIDACGQYVKLRRSSDTMPYNEPPVVVGYDDHAPRVRMLAEQIAASRPAGPEPGEAHGDRRPVTGDRAPSRGPGAP